MKTPIPKINHNFRSLKVSELDPAVFSYDLPSAISPSAKYIFFLHGKIAEKHGPNGMHPCFGIYDYHGIVKFFANFGFTVISEIRPEGTKLDQYAKKIARQIKTLLSNGIPAA